MIRDNNKMKYNIFYCLDDADTKNKKMKDVNTEKLKGTQQKTKIIEGYELVLEPRFHAN
jgi:hypothetical protein